MAFAAVQKAEHPVAPAAAAEGAPRGDGNHILQASEFPLSQPSKSQTGLALLQELPGNDRSSQQRQEICQRM